MVNKLEEKMHQDKLNKNRIKINTKTAADIDNYLQQ